MCDLVWSFTALGVSLIWAVAWVGRAYLEYGSPVDPNIDPEEEEE